DGNVFELSVIEEGPIAAVTMDPPHVLPRSIRESRLNLPPDQSAIDDSLEVHRNCSAGDPGVLPHRSARAALVGRPMEHDENAGRNLESGGQLSPNSHELAHCSPSDRGASVVRPVEPNENAARNLESGGELRHVNPFDSDPRTTEVHAAYRRPEWGSSPSGTMRVLSEGSTRQYGHKGNYGVSQKRHLSGVGRPAVGLVKETQQTYSQKGKKKKKMEEILNFNLTCK
ncbi:hypothetical protein Ancab_038910, partial [Ancistrocladus abbreviatus]